MENRRRDFYRFLFIIYCAGLFWVLFARNRYDPALPYWEQVRAYLNLTPFHTIRLYLRLLLDPVRPVLTKLAVYNLLGNVLLFLPMGAFLPLLFPRLRGFFRTLPAAALVTIVVEILQVLLLAGSCDIDDVILNLLGTALGYPFYRILRYE